MVEDDGYRAWFKAERSRSVRPVTPEDFAALRELNVVVDETDESITLSPPCPTASHRPERRGLVPLGAKQVTSHSAWP